MKESVAMKSLHWGRCSFEKIEQVATEWNTIKKLEISKVAQESDWVTFFILKGAGALQNDDDEDKI